MAASPPGADRETAVVDTWNQAERTGWTMLAVGVDQDGEAASMAPTGCEGGAVPFRSRAQSTSAPPNGGRPSPPHP